MARPDPPVTRGMSPRQTRIPSASGGTAASLKATLAAAAADPQVVEWMRSPFALTPGFEGPAQPPGHKPMVDEALGLVDG